jgi:hypothetical protein
MRDRPVGFVPNVGYSLAMHGLQQVAGFEPEFSFTEPDSSLYFSLGMILSENRFPLFGIMPPKIRRERRDEIRIRAAARFRP